MNKLSTQKSFQKVFAKEFMEMIDDAFFLFDYSLRFIFVNKKATQLIGKNKKELLGKRIDDVFPEVKQAKIYTEFLKSRKFNKNPIEYYSPSMKKWLSVSVFPIHYGIVVYAKDITGKKEAEMLLFESEEKYRLVVESTVDLVSIFNTEGKFIYASPSYKDVLGHDPKSLIGLSMFSTPDPNDSEKVKSIFKRILKGEKIRKFMTKGIDNKGNIHFLEASGSAIFDNHGKPYMVVSVAHDVTEREENEQRKEDFIAMTSHELKTPLTSAKIFIQFLKKRFTSLKDKESFTLLQKVDRVIDQLEILIKELLDATLTNQKKLSLKKENFIFRDLVLQTISELQLSIHNKIVVNLQTKKYVHADKEKISQVLINFITNAAKYSPKKTNIIVKSREKGKFIVVSIQDFGIGVAKKDKTHIFDRFYKGSKSKTYPGLGLGLYITKEIIKENGGEIWVESTEGKGSTFYFSLPMYTGK